MGRAFPVFLHADLCLRRGRSFVRFVSIVDRGSSKAFLTGDRLQKCRRRAKPHEGGTGSIFFHCSETGRASIDRLAEPRHGRGRSGWAGCLGACVVSQARLHRTLRSDVHARSPLSLLGACCCLRAIQAGGAPPPCRTEYILGRRPLHSDGTGAAAGAAAPSRLASRHHNNTTRAGASNQTLCAPLLRDRRTIELTRWCSDLRKARPRSSTPPPGRSCGATLGAAGPPCGRSRGVGGGGGVVVV